MNRLFEWLLGLDAGFLSRDGEISLSFAPKWPLSNLIGTFTWNVLLVALCVGIVWLVYHRGRNRQIGVAGWAMASMRMLVLLIVVALLNRPQLTLTQSRVEPSVLAIVVDDSTSMRLNDVPLAVGPTSQPAGTMTRLAAVQSLLNAGDGKLVGDLAKLHQLRGYHFSNDAQPLNADATKPNEVGQAVNALQPAGAQTRVVNSLETVARELQGQRIAGIVLLSDGRETETASAEGDPLAALHELNVKVYPVPVGSDAGLRNVEVDSVAIQDAVFSGDIVNVKVGVRGVGVPPGVPVKLTLRDAGGIAVLDNGKPVETTVTFPADGGLVNTELQFVPSAVGTLDLSVEASRIEGEIDDKDNARLAQVAVLDARLRVLYVDGYPRWEYRYLTQELIRDPSIEVSCLLTSADATFAQEGDRPITRFPETIDELMEYDVVLFGDVDPRQFTDNQLQLVNEFVSRRGGGFGMTAGPRFAPSKYANTAIEPLLPVDITRVETTRDLAPGSAEGFRLALTEEGKDNSIFRFFRDAQANTDFLTGKLQLLFWYQRGVTVKPGVGQVLANHPSETSPDGRPSPIVVAGRFGTGRTLFSAIDDSWRWRYYTGEQIFNSYWVQTLRYLARGKKLGQRKLTLAAERPVYQLGESVRASVRVLDPALLTQLGDELRVQVIDERGQAVRDLTLLRRSAQGDAYTGGFTADRLGRFSIRMNAPAADMGDLTVPLEMAVPRLELNDPKVDRAALDRLAAATGGQVVDLKDATNLPAIIQSAAKDIPVLTSMPLAAAPLALALFTVLITAEWILRKREGMV